MAEPFLTSDSRFTKERSGIVKIDLVYAVPGPSEHGGAEPYETLNSFSPAKPMDLPLTTRQATKANDGSWDLVLSYEGLVNNEKGEMFAEIDYASVEDPIETFENFEALIESYDSKDQFDEETGRFQGFKRLLSAKFASPLPNGKRIKNPMYGQKNFFNDNPILRVSFVQRDYSREYMRNICKIDNPLFPPGQNEVADTLEGKQWLKRSVKAQFRGNCWAYQIDWLLGNWAPAIYNPTK